MQTRSLLRPLVRALLALVVLAAVSSPLGQDALAASYQCGSNQDYFTKRCTVHPNSITRIVDGVVKKGHLVGCQFKSYSCLDGQCRDNYGSAVIPYSFSQDSLADFCSLLCVNPSCAEAWK